MKRLHSDLNDFHQILLGYDIGIATDFLEDDLHLGPCHTMGHVDIRENPLHAIQSNPVTLLGHRTDDFLLKP